MHYVDAARFAGLFEAAGANRDEICRTLHLMATRLARGRRWPVEADREDAVGDAVCHAIARLGNFDPRLSRNAFAYFTRVLETRLLKSAAKNSRRRATEIPLISDM